MSTNFLSSSEAFRAMFVFLEKYYELTKADDVGALLGSLAMLPDGKPADGAMWDEWLTAIQDARQYQINGDQAAEDTGRC